jgi:dTDP-glucose 4,6-dehydratase|tara:strand:- start:34 stop:1065 length:1032 start_codon:yes stop_codon:yes gene_type:complete
MRVKNMNILVTGGLGFIGSNFIRHMLNKNHCQIINLDKVTYCANFENLKDVEKNANYKFVKGDICDKNIVGKLVKKVDVIINFAAETHVDRSITAPGDFIKTDVFGTYVLLEAARKFNIKKYIQISTDEVYGSIRKGSFKETDSLNPSSPYSASKASADHLVSSYFDTYGLPILITRSSNNFGPNQYPEKLIPLFITNLLDGKKIPVYGDGLNVRDWVYVLDNCEAVNLVLDKGKTGEIYNIGGGNEKTNIEIARALLKELGKEKSFIEFVKDRMGHDKRYSLDCSKLRGLGWKPRYNFDQAIESTIGWYKENQEWWTKIKSPEYLAYYKKHYYERHKMESQE